MDEQLLKNIIETRRIIRKKYEDLQSGKAQDASTFERMFESISTPLKMMVKPEKPEKQTNEHIVVKKRDKSPTSSVSDATFPAENYVPEEYNYTPEETMQDTTPNTSQDFFSMEEEDEDAPSASKKPRTRHQRTTDKYVKTIMSQYDVKHLDNIYGPHYDEDDGVWKLGDSVLNMSHKNLSMNGKQYPLTSGLRDLIFFKKPVDFTNSEATKYLRIMNDSNALNRSADKRNSKYKFVQKLYKETQAAGKGLMKYSTNKIDYVHWSNINSLVNRLRLLIASQHAGNRNHGNEIQSILQELRDENIIE